MRGIAMAIIWLGFVLDMRFDRCWQRRDDKDKAGVERFVALWLLATVTAIICGV
ncbi:MAG: hypothetical protein WC683_18365 [bacterium]